MVQEDFKDDYIVEFENVCKMFRRRSEEGFFRGDLLVYKLLRRKREEAGLVRALESVSFKVGRGECLGVLGPNGAGKTTLLKLACSLLLPDSGSVYVNGLDTREHTDKTKSMAMIIPGSRFFGFNELLSPESNLMYWAAVFQVPRARAKELIEEALKVFGLSEVRDRRVMFLSSGMRQRLNMARSFLAGRTVWALDEPTIHLDPWVAEDIRQLVKNVLVGERRYTILLASQNIYELEKLCDKILVLNKGKVVLYDSVDNVKSKLGHRRRIKITFDQALGKNHIETLTSEFDIVNVGDNYVEIITKNAVETLPKLYKLLRRLGLKPSDILVTEPSLEEIILKLLR
ncbi:hypothetical protein DRO58_06140 [Candidatus Bathyarchaeota archaeon]|nr:MAG: hypothetical protein DRO58_06140 [Candidatus Bathyarchaeota archaeon]